jgi:hypothetical protein
MNDVLGEVRKIAGGGDESHVYTCLCAYVGAYVGEEDCWWRG